CSRERRPEEGSPEEPGVTGLRVPSAPRRSAKRFPCCAGGIAGRCAAVARVQGKRLLALAIAVSVNPSTRPPERRRPGRCGEPCEGPPAVSTPLYQLKAEFFKTLGHPARIRVLELLSERDHAVAEMLPEVGIEPAHLSQQLAVLRRAGLVVSRKEGTTVIYSLTSPQVADLLAVARSILTGVLAGQAELLDDLRSGGAAGGRG